MKPGDKVRWAPHVDCAYLKSIDGEEAVIWWPCDQYGRHEKHVPLSSLEYLGEGIERYPKRLDVEHVREELVGYEDGIEWEGQGGAMVMVKKRVPIIKKFRWMAGRDIKPLKVEPRPLTPNPDFP